MDEYNFENIINIYKDTDVSGLLYNSLPSHLCGECRNKITNVYGCLNILDKNYITNISFRIYDNLKCYLITVWI